jgi:hypothetical protein
MDGSMAKKPDCGLQLDQDLSLQYLHWRLERLGWVCMALVICAGLLGAFGHHPFATTIQQTPDKTLLIEYDRYARYESNVEFRLTVESEQHTPTELRVWFDEAYLDTVKVVGVSPVPMRGEAGDGRRAFVFQRDGSRFTATFFLQFQRAGILRGTLGVDERKTLSFHHVVWP